MASSAFARPTGIVGAKLSVAFGGWKGTNLSLLEWNAAISIGILAGCALGFLIRLLFKLFGLIRAAFIRRIVDETIHQLRWGSTEFWQEIRRELGIKNPRPPRS